MKIKFTLDEGAYAPEKAHEADAGFDLRAMYDSMGELEEYGQEAFDTGVHVEIPKGYVGYVQGRSGLNFKYGIICPTGTVDSGFTGSIKVKLYNMWNPDYNVPVPEIKAGDKIAQLVIQPLADCTMVQVDNLGETERGDNGFGSTGR
jgi:dUTP pyrophosphatase